METFPAERTTLKAPAGELPALWRAPAEPRALLALAHGAGAGMEHAFLEALSAALAAEGVATLRYAFPFTARGGRRPDPPALLEATVRAAAAAARERAPELPLLAGGKSLGGRMSSRAQAAAALPGVCGLVFFGFPLHPPKRPGRERAAHLAQVALPMLFLQGTRDSLADLAELRPVCEALGGRAVLHVIEGADHGFHVPKRSGRDDASVIAELARVTASWAAALPV